jgi:Lon protease-like protein
MDTIDRKLPLFPLNVVLFPRMMMPLHIFEDRYKAMIQACLDSDSRFGVVLIKQGQEVGAPAIPYTTGTVAMIRRITPLDDGTLNVMAMGERRFHIREIVWEQPYITALVSLPEEPAGDPPPTAEVIEPLRVDLEEYLRTLLGLRGGWVREVDCPTDPVELSFYMASVLRGDNQERQRILEAPTARERIQLLTPLLRQEHQRIRSQLEKHMTPPGAWLN